MSDELTVEVALKEEICETLEALAIRRHVDHKSWCWCQKRWDATKPHEENCARARALFAKLGCAFKQSQAKEQQS